MKICFFSSRVVSTVIFLVMLSLLLGLGFWQLYRGRQKAELQAAFAQQSHQPPVDLAAVNPIDPNNYYRRVIAKGQYDSAHQILLDNQIRDGQPGYHVLTPLRLPDGHAILVNRGWIALGESRQTLPDITAPMEIVTADGWLAQPAQPGLRLGDAAGSDLRWPRVTLYIDYDRLATILGYPLQPAIILLDPKADWGYGRDWRPHFGGFGPERHQGYAVQWFALAAVLVIVRFAVHTRRTSPSSK